MKQITRYDWMTYQTHDKLTSVDVWYVGVANRILSELSDRKLAKKEGAARIRRIALFLALYLEDLVTEKGGWHLFVEKYRSVGKGIVPFCPAGTKERHFGKHKLYDIRFLMWAAHTGRYGRRGAADFISPYDPDWTDAIKRASMLIMDAYEEAPVARPWQRTRDWLNAEQCYARPVRPVMELLMGVKLSPMVEKFLLASGGEQLMYIGSYRELCRFFVDGLRWEDKEEDLIPDLRESDRFVLYANPKGMLIAPGAAAYFCDPRNPYYDQAESRNNAYTLLTEPGACPFDLLKYGISRGLLDDIYYDSLHPDVPAVWIQEDWDFIARWFLGNYYEGE